MTTVERGHEVQRSSAQPRRTPYQGLLPFSEEDADYFFGRTAWRGIISDHLLAYRVTLLYGPSGVGKSSVLRAGVVHELRKVAKQNLELSGRPELLPAIVSTWSGDPVRSIDDGLQATGARLWPTLPFEPPSGSLIEVVSRWADRADGRVLLVLDQFDEYFMYQTARPGGLAFVDELSEVLAGGEIALNVLISIREDALAKLDRFDDPNVDLWQNLLRIDHLDAEAAREAIEKPIERWNEREAAEGKRITLEPKLVDAVLAETTAGAIRIGVAGRGFVETEEPERQPTTPRVEAPYLQLVMTRLWEEERRRGSRVLRVGTLNRMGGTQQIARRHFDSVMRELSRRERLRAAKILEYLVTPAGTKIALPASALAKWSKQREKKIAPILAKLAGGEQRILRTVSSPGDESGAASYEIFHDRLAAGILDWRHRYVRRRRQTRVAALVLPILLAVGLVGAGVIYDQYQRNERLSQDLAQFEAEARQFRKRQEDVEKTARRSPFFARMLPPHEAFVNSADFSPDGRRVATASADNSVIVADAATGRRLHSLRMTLGGEGGMTRVVFSPRGDLIGVETGDEWASIWDGVSARLPFRFTASSSFNSLAFTRDGRRVVAAGEGGSVHLWDVSTGKRVATFGRRRGDAGDTATISPDGTLVAAARRGRVRVWDVSSRVLRRTLRVGTFPTDVQFAPDSRVLLTVSPGSAILWSTRTWRPTRLAGAPRTIGTLLEGGFPHLDRLADFSDDKVVVAGRKEAVVSSVRGIRIAGLRHSRATTIARFSPDGSIIATGTARGELRVWSVDGRLLKVLLPGAGAAIEWLAFSRDGRRLVSAGDDGTSIVWNVEPDLAVADSAVTAPGRTELLVKARVVNLGLRDSGPALLRVRVSDGSQTILRLKSLAPGAGRTLRFTLPQSRNPTPLLSLQVTPRDPKSDARRGNNEAKLTLGGPVE